MELKSPKYFNRVTKAMEQLQRAGINSDLNERRDKALFYLKKTGEYDPAVREWENKTAATKMWTNIKMFISS
jgi:AICAR transformylase/IMP cyclohydrolase PurH